MYIVQGAHESGFVNRDVRPNNIMVHSDSQQLYLIDWGTAVAANIGAVPFAGVPHYSSLRIISQLMCDEVGSYTKADDLEALVCSAFCCTHPSLQTELESFDKADFESIWDWWQGTAWQERPSWRKAIIAARATDYARVQKLLVKLME